MDNKIIFSDVDGTLIYKGEPFNSVRFPVLLEKLQNSGVFFGVCTGRSYCELEPILRPDTDSIVSICCEGACTYESGKLTAGLPIDGRTVENFFRLADRLNAALELHTERNAYLYRAPFPLFSKESKRLTTVEKIDSIPKSPVYKVALYSERYKADTGSFSDVRLSYCADGICEYVNKDADKHSAVESFLHSAGLTFGDLLYFGDGENDKELLVHSARSFTTYCAAPSVFSLAKEHTRDVIGTIIRLCGEKAN